VRVEGHTDNVPIHTNRFPSNWELSIARAVSVVKYFVDVGNINPQRLSAVGYGESRPLVPNSSAANLAKNRRVEIVLATEDEK
jgi:chemotaxis protein MotB